MDLIRESVAVKLDPEWWGARIFYNSTQTMSASSGLTIQFLAHHLAGIGTWIK